MNNTSIACIVNELREHILQNKLSTLRPWVHGIAQHPHVHTLLRCAPDDTLADAYHAFRAQLCAVQPQWQAIARRAGCIPDTIRHIARHPKANPRITTVLRIEAALVSYVSSPLCASDPSHPTTRKDSL